MLTVTRSVPGKKLGPGRRIYLTTPRHLVLPEENTILGLPGASPAAGVTDPQGHCAPRVGGAPVVEKKLEGRLWLCWPAGGPGGQLQRIATLLSLRVENASGDGASGEARVPPPGLHYSPKPASARGCRLHRGCQPHRDSVIKASGALMTEGLPHGHCPGLQCGPRTEPTARARSGRRAPRSL